MNVLFRQANCDDFKEVYAVESVCFFSPWSQDSIHHELCGNPIAKYIVAIVEDRIIGFCGVHTILDEGHITNVAVLPEYRGKGIGEGLVRALFKATQNTLNRYTLEVRASNFAAIRLYTRIGFRIEGTRLGYYEDTQEDALIMWIG